MCYLLSKPIPWGEKLECCDGAVIWSADVGTDVVGASGVVVAGQ